LIITVKSSENMATSKSKSTTPASTAKSVLSAFQQDLFAILDGLQTKATTDASNETTALNAYIQAEGSLVSKSTSFGGPSPNFTSPTWSGSTTPNGAKSYQKTFEKTITNVLLQQTASQEEQSIIMQNLQINLMNVFKASFAKMFPSGTASMDQQSAIKWVQDSIIEANNYLGVNNQEGLINQMTSAIFSGDAPPTSGTFSTDYEPWVNAQLKTYLATIQQQGPNVEQTTQQILKLLQGALGQYNLNNEESIMEWVQTTISGLSGSTVTNLQKQELIGALEQDVIQMFPQPDASFFYSNLQTLLLQNIYNPARPSAASTQISTPAAPKNLSVVVVNNNAEKTLTAFASGGQLPAGGSYQYEWTNVTEPSKKVSTQKKNPAMAINLTEGDTYALTVSDGTSTAQPTNTAALKIYKTPLLLRLSGKVTNVTLYGGDNGAATVEVVGGKAPYAFTWTNLETTAKVASTTGSNKTTSTANDLKAGTYLVEVTDSTKKAAATATLLVAVTQPAASANNGIKSVIEQVLGLSSDGTPSSRYIEVNSTLATQLETAIKASIRQSIANTFNKLPEYGAQGRLISSTYDYQLISRIADYVEALVNELKSDYNNFIPTNSSNALQAAQNITSTAVAFRDFAVSLSEITAAFKSELNHPKGSANPKPGQTGYTYNEVKNLISNYSSNPNLTDLGDLAKAIYLSTNANKVPLIQTAELEGVKLASSTAGLSTSLNKLLTGDQSATLSSLTNMKQNAKTSYNMAYSNYDSLAKDYFTEIDSYIAALQEFNYDSLKVDAINNALNTLTQVIETGISHQGFTNVYAKT
ncbi:MAG: SprB repeat-containing protein, partial [Bacteroidota bacterium]